ncbi:hypothetical protein BELINDA_24 [Bacillus phage Belinda]|uniref:hypothetical protein n=1 Tax=Bacillus phage Belinda TaxID=1852564 RepID=UPI0007F11E89|nr:hypothetical protein BI039_gp024 [Bacillus phage Belinda]ANM45953.1 hypothetical protein BELINDA_24 [Bacillus phage Belinda]
MAVVYKCEHNKENNDLDQVKLSVVKNKLKFVFRDDVRDVKINIKLDKYKAELIGRALHEEIHDMRDGYKLGLTKDREFGVMRSYCESHERHHIIYGQQGIALVSVHLDDDDIKDLHDNIMSFVKYGEI